MMKRIVDRDTLVKLGALDEEFEVCDEAGRTLGFFQPVADRELYALGDCPFSEEELDAAERQGGGRPLADILADLAKRP